MHHHPKPTKIFTLIQNSKGVIKDQKRLKSLKITDKDFSTIQKPSPLCIKITQKDSPKREFSECSKKSYSIQKIELNVSSENEPFSPIRHPRLLKVNFLKNDSKFRPFSAGNKSLFFRSGKQRRRTSEDHFVVAGQGVFSIMQKNPKENN
jgi:hypothetical protein